MRITFDIKNISKYISAKEAWGSSQTAIRKGLSNNPTFKHVNNMINLGEKFFDPLREHFNMPIIISSMYRSKALNTAIGGARASDHLTGEAVDIDMDIRSVGPSNNEIFNYILDNCKYYKLIGEFPIRGRLSWVHVSFKKDDQLNEEQQVYIATRDSNGRTVYVPYESNKHLIY